MFWFDSELWAGFCVGKLRVVGGIRHLISPSHTRYWGHSSNPNHSTPRQFCIRNVSWVKLKLYKHSFLASKEQIKTFLRCDPFVLVNKNRDQGFSALKWCLIVSCCHPILSQGCHTASLFTLRCCSAQWTKPIWLQDLSIISLDAAATATRSHFKFIPASQNLPRSEIRSPDLPCPSGAWPWPDYHRWWWILNKTLHWEMNKWSPTYF